MQERDRGFGRRSRTPSTFAQIPCGTTPLVTPRTLAQFWTRGALGSWLACGAALTRTLRQVGPDSLDLDSTKRVWAASNHVGGKPEPCRRLFRVTTSRSIAASWIPIRLSRCEEGGNPCRRCFSDEKRPQECNVQTTTSYRKLRAKTPAGHAATMLRRQRCSIWRCEYELNTQHGWKAVERERTYILRTSTVHSKSQHCSTPEAPSKLSTRVFRCHHSTFSIALLTTNYKVGRIVSTKPKTKPWNTFFILS
jgi:hypothetical protein